MPVSGKNFRFLSFSENRTFFLCDHIYIIDSYYVLLLLLLVVVVVVVVRMVVIFHITFMKDV
jgi:hypothetical protein